MIQQHEFIILAGIAVLFVVIGIWLILVQMLFTRLKHHHPDIYDALGNPTLKDGGTDIPQTASLLLFLTRREYIGIGDPKLTKVATRMRLLLFGLPVYFIVVILFSIIMI